jgi:hypothetical protein
MNTDPTQPQPITPETRVPLNRLGELAPTAEQLGKLKDGLTPRLPDGVRPALQQAVEVARLEHDDLDATVGRILTALAPWLAPTVPANGLPEDALIRCSPGVPALQAQPVTATEGATSAWETKIRTMLELYARYGMYGNEEQLQESFRLKAEILAVLSRVPQPEPGKDTERLDWLQGWLRNMDSATRGTWLRIGDKGRIQVHRIHPDRHPGRVALVWDDDECLLDSITETGTNDLRSAIDAAITASTKGTGEGRA